MLKEKTSDVSMTNTNQGSGTAAEAAVPMSHGLWNTWRKNLLLFCLTGVYVELCLHLCVFGSMDRYAGYPVLFGLLGGALCTLVVSSLPKVLRQITGLLLVAAQVMLAEVQLVYHCIFGDFMPVSQIGMGGNVIVNFNSQLLAASLWDPPKSAEDPAPPAAADCRDPLPYLAEGAGSEAAAALEAGTGLLCRAPRTAADGHGTHVCWTGQSLFRLSYLHQCEHLHRQQL